MTWLLRDQDTWFETIMISEKKVAELGNALAEINRHYTAEDMRRILDYALEHRQMLGYPHDVADMLEDFAKRLRQFDWKPDRFGHWKAEAKQAVQKRKSRG
jgi:alkanesulfonate monooxygenase SsuD/methylene tetrahydromethanopterin reductase-like flavin-dependent oxidoreductase (luciferase family)